MAQFKAILNFLTKKKLKLLFFGLYALALLIAPFFTYGNLVGISGLLLVIAASVLWRIQGGIISGVWATLCLLLSVFVSPYEVSAIHLNFYSIGIIVYFFVGIGLGKSVNCIYTQQVKIRRNEEKFRLIFEHSPFGELHFDRWGTVTACNDNLIKIIGSSREALIGFNTLILPDTRVVEAIRGALEGKSTTYEGDYQSVTAPKVTPVRASFAPLVLADGQVDGGFGIVEDISERLEAENIIKDSEEKFRQMATHMEEVFWLRSKDNQKMLYISPAYEKVWGRTCQSLYDNPNTFLDSVYNKDKELVYAEFEKYMDGGSFDIEYRIKRPDGTIRWIWARSFPITDEEGTITRHTGIAVNVTDRKQAEKRLHYQLAFQKMVADISAGFVNFSREDMDEAIDNALKLTGEFFQADRSYLFQFAADGQTMDNTHEWCAPGIIPQIKRIKDFPVKTFPWWSQQIHSHQSVHIPDIETLPVEAAVEQREFAAQGIQSLLSIPISADGKVKGFFGFDTVRQKKAWRKEEIHFLKVIGSIFSNALVKKETQKQLEHLSLHDQLTGLYNRTYFENELKRLKNSGEYPITIISLDLDGLKVVNDTMGHAAGDDLLKRCARVAKRALRKSDTLARVGGDEFVALLEGADEKVAQEVLQRLNGEIVENNRGQGQLPLMVSIGISTAEAETRPLEEVLKEADHRMYRAKAQQSGRAKSQIIGTLMTVLGERDLFNAQRLVTLCHMVGEQMGLSAKQLSDIALLAYVHNLGMIGISDDILAKNGPLSKGEWEIIRQHPEKGHRIAVSSPELCDIADLILKHHEKWDGTGYPMGIKGSHIPIECRIFSIVEAYDAMTSDRPYRRPMSGEEACWQIGMHAGTQFDPAVVEIFLLQLQSELVSGS